MMKRFSDVMWTMQEVLFKGIDIRLAAYLINECGRSGLNVVSKTHEEIARHMSSAREVISRMLKRFEDDGLVKLSRGKILITDKAALEDYAGAKKDKAS